MGIVYAACTSPSPYQYRCWCWCGCCLRIAPRVASPVLFSVEAGGFQRRLRKISREPPPITDTHPPPPSSKAQHQARTEHMQQRLDDAKHQSTLLQQKMIALDAHYRHQVRTSTARLSVPVRALGCDERLSLQIDLLLFRSRRTQGVLPCRLPVHKLTTNLIYPCPRLLRG